MRNPEQIDASTVNQGFRALVAPASTCLTAACETPNCRAMIDGLMPAMKAARTAFVFPTLSAGTASSEAVGASEEAGFFSPAGRGTLSTAGLTSAGFIGALVTSGGNRPRCVASAVTAASSVSISPSPSRLSAPGRSFGNRYPTGAGGLIDSTSALGAIFRSAGALLAAAANKSGVGSFGRRSDMGADYAELAVPEQAAINRAWPIKRSSDF
jgi:hypothetical protein